MDSADDSDDESASAAAATGDDGPSSVVIAGVVGGVVGTVLLAGVAYGLHKRSAARTNKAHLNVPNVEHPDTGYLCSVGGLASVGGFASVLRGHVARNQGRPFVVFVGVRMAAVHHDVGRLMDAL